jgi:WD40 repeat protein
VIPLRIPGANGPSTPALAVCRDRSGRVSFLDPFRTDNCIIMRTPDTHTAGIRAIIQLDEWRLASGGYDDMMFVWDLRNISDDKTKCQPLFQTSSSVQTFKKTNSVDGEPLVLAVGNRDGSVTFWGNEMYAFSKYCTPIRFSAGSRSFFFFFFFFFSVMVELGNWYKEGIWEHTHQV